MCVIDIYVKYAWVVLLKVRKGILIINGFQKVLDESNRRIARSKTRKTNKLSVDKSSEFYNKSMKSWFQENVIEMYSTHNEGKSAVAQRLIKTLRTKFLNIWFRY